MKEKFFRFSEPTVINLTGETVTGTKKVVTTVKELTVKKRKSSAGFSWITDEGNQNSISFTTHDIDIAPEEVRDWFESVDEIE